MFVFKRETRNDITIYTSGAFWSLSKRKAGRSYSLQQIKSCWEYLIKNYSQQGSKILYQATSIHMGLDTAPFFTDPFLVFYECKRLKSIKSADYGVERNFVNVLLIAINDGNEFESNYNEI